MNGAILLAGAWFHDLQTALYSAIFIFVCARVVDAVLAGINPQKIVLVVSDCSEDIAQALMHQMKSGVTFLQGEGGFTRREKKVICSVVRSMDVPRFKACVLVWMQKPCWWLTTHAKWRDPGHLPASAQKPLPRGDRP
jgi:uncharacterized membrane-anchored protein YitT (DUF2179 family)